MLVLTKEEGKYRLKVVEKKRFPKDLLLAFGLALLIHIVAALLFHVSLYHYFVSPFIFPPVTATASIQGSTTANDRSYDKIAIDEPPLFERKLLEETSELVTYYSPYDLIDLSPPKLHTAIHIFASGPLHKAEIQTTFLPAQFETGLAIFNVKIDPIDQKVFWYEWKHRTGHRQLDLQAEKTLLGLTVKGTSHKGTIEIAFNND